MSLPDKSTDVPAQAYPETVVHILLPVPKNAPVRLALVIRNPARWRELLGLPNIEDGKSSHRLQTLAILESRMDPIPSYPGRRVENALKNGSTQRRELDVVGEAKKMYERNETMKPGRGWELKGRFRKALAWLRVVSGEKKQQKNPDLRSIILGGLDRQDYLEVANLWHQSANVFLLRTETRIRKDATDLQQQKSIDLINCRLEVFNTLMEELKEEVGDDLTIAVLNVKGRGPSALPRGPSKVKFIVWEDGGERDHGASQEKRLPGLLARGHNYPESKAHPLWI